MANTYKAIATTIVGSGGASTIEFTSIPGTYTDLCILFSGRTNSNDAPGYATLQFNGNSSAVYSRRQLQADGSTVYSFYASSETAINYIYTGGGSGTSNTFGNTYIYIPNYTSSSANKSISVDTVQENNTSTNAWPELQAGLWANTSAITSITLGVLNVAAQTIFVQYSTATLYGIRSS